MYGSPQPGAFFPGHGSCPNCGYCSHCGRSDKPKAPYIGGIGIAGGGVGIGLGQPPEFPPGTKVDIKQITDPEQIARIQDLMQSMDEEPDMELPKE